ncbi:Two component system, signal transduction histidine kinase [Acididesulfobacillus acetoxydans]|uniref:histidine kinase n=1 Tax=Acididesulfobacillus acetoxydans TaxID=1561005 RepID=A0A8S0W8X4_9FIRM|nr:HAMP domain-containing sensor histidine kinase [Acididesulfobacillus acetoxydans]CAA7602169.1 Two component system, signal transduction histidine kinase [Acididesulfobacillus acetoxydans]CEJ08725.1 Alkaline phosphatase synthesis sensor protein PhoR [Acididesulfobacillus acetoxydans]
MNGIRARLTANFMFIIIITVTILEILLIYAVRQNFYGSLESSLTNQIKISADLYAKYFSDNSLQENVLYNVDAFWNQSNAEVEIVDKSGTIVMDSLGMIPQGKVMDRDIGEALKGGTGSWIGTLNGQKVVAVSYPLREGPNIVGALRFISSLREVDKDVENTASVFIGIGLVVIMIAGLISVFLANTIVVPLKEVTEAARKMAAGDFSIRSRKVRSDEIGKLSETLDYMAQEIVKKEQLKNDFISSVSHELRTPLTSILGWAITLQNENFQGKETLNDGLGIIAKESERLTLMVEELLDFSKFVSGRVKLQKTETEMTYFLEHLKKQLTPRAARENIDFMVSYPEDLPVLYTDANRLKQVFINVLDNAFNFTPAGGQVALSVAAEAGEFIFTVTDTGCGIAVDELPKVKEKFYKGRGSGSKNGIGLSICQEIVTLMGGRLEIASQLAAGTKVVISIPREEASDRRSI